jgi:16S rRNA (adenine1518-N6/adenine1519-N6)-dimethyltransferase
MPVSAKNFSPIPKVDSAVLKISKISKCFFIENKIEENSFFIFLKSAFSSKRKKMIKNIVENFLKKTSENSDTTTTEFSLSKKQIEEIFHNLKIDLNIRAEDLSLEDFKNIYKKIFHDTKIKRFQPNQVV